MKKIIQLLVLLFFVSSTNLKAQEEVFEIQLATYAAPDYKHFHKLYKTGYVYTVEQSNGLSKVYMGTYTDKKLARKKLSLVQQKGFKDAFLVKKSIKEEDAVYVVQLATYDQQADIYWADWQRLSSSLMVQLSDSKARVCAGYYYTREEAAAAQQRIKNRGAKDVFVKKVSSKVLHKVSSFDRERSPSYGQQVGKNRNSVKALQQVLLEEKLYDAKPNGLLTAATQSAIIKYKKTNARYLRYQSSAERLDFDNSPEIYTLQYYINMVSSDPKKAAAGLKQFKHPISKVFLAYLYLNEDVGVQNKTMVVNGLMNNAMAAVFKNYRGKTRYDFSMKYSYEEMSQLLSHLKAMYEVVKDKPDMPCWLFKRHPRLTSKVFASYWDNSKDNYTVSTDCGSFMDSEEMRMLFQVSKDFASEEKDIIGYTAINRYYIVPQPLSYQEMEELEKWNGLLWENLKKWSEVSPMQKNMYKILRFSYYDALQKAETHFMNKGQTGIEARDLGLKLIRETVGANLREYYQKLR